MHSRPVSLMFSSLTCLSFYRQKRDGTLTSFKGSLGVTTVESTAVQDQRSLSQHVSSAWLTPVRVVTDTFLHTSSANVLLSWCPVVTVSTSFGRDCWLKRQHSYMDAICMKCCSSTCTSRSTLGRLSIKNSTGPPPLCQRKSVTCRHELTRSRHISQKNTC